MRSWAMVLALVAASCAPARQDDGRPSVVASFFPLAELARTAGGDRVRVVDLTPPGAEPHDLELGSDAVDDVLDADLIVYVGGGFQPALERVLDRAPGRKLDVADGSNDVHVWLDPVAMRDAAVRVASALEAPPAAAGFADLDGEFRAGLSGCARDLIVTSHASFGRLAVRYGLRQESLSTAGPEAEPDPRRLAELADIVRRESVTTVFTEPGAPDAPMATLARETGATVDVLDPIERSGEPYEVRMRRNLAALRKALGCP